MVVRQQCILLPVEVASSQQGETLAERKKEGGDIKEGDVERVKNN